jgi:hypothetical protein
MHLHHQQAARTFRHRQLQHLRRELGRRTFVDVALQLVRLGRRRNANDGFRAADDPIAHAQHHGAAAAVGHAHGHVHGQAHGMAMIGRPFLEVEVLRLQRVGIDLIEPDEERANFGEFPHQGLCSFRGPANTFTRSGR